MQLKLLVRDEAICKKYEKLFHKTAIENRHFLKRQEVVTAEQLRSFLEHFRGPEGMRAGASRAGLVMREHIKRP